MQHLGQAESGVAVILGVFATIGAGFSILMAPQALRIDMRQDLQHLELLKTWPVKASAVVRGEILGPGVIVAVSVAMLTPALVFAQCAVHNGVALMFPAWVPSAVSGRAGSTRWGSASSCSAARC